MVPTRVVPGGEFLQMARPRSAMQHVPWTEKKQQSLLVGQRVGMRRNVGE